MVPDVPPPDVVYVVREGDNNEELRYSLRSLRNLPHGRVWIAGYCPKWLQNVGRIPVPPGPSKYESSTANLRAAAEHPEVSERFIYCNDDFYVVEPLDEVPTLHRGPVADVLAYYQAKHPGSPYVEGIAATVTLLDGCFEIVDPLSYELHVPMVMERRKVVVALAAAAEWGSPMALHKRTLYGNLWHLCGEQVADCKVHDGRDPWPTGPFVSSCDKSFVGPHGRRIRRMFPDPSPYESPLFPPPLEHPDGVLLRHWNGAMTVVSDEKAERMLRQGFSRVVERPDPT